MTPGQATVTVILTIVALVCTVTLMAGIRTMSHYLAHWMGQSRDSITNFLNGKLGSFFSDTTVLLARCTELLEQERDANTNQTVIVCISGMAGPDQLFTTSAAVPDPEDSQICIRYEPLQTLSNPRVYIGRQPDGATVALVEVRIGNQHVLEGPAMSVDSKISIHPSNHVYITIAQLQSHHRGFGWKVD